jgi:hypothetical protein
MPKNLTVRSTFGGQVSPNAGPNFLEQFGIDPRSQQEILQAMEKQRITDAMSANDNRRGDFAGDLELQDSGAALAAMLANRFNKPKLSPTQQRAADAKEAADKNIALMESGGKFNNEDGELDVIAKTDEYQRILASELIKVGDPRGIDMARDLQKRMQENRVYEEEREAAGLAIEGAKTQNRRGLIGEKRDRVVLDKAQFDLDRQKFIAKRGELAPIYIAGSDNPNASIMSFIGDDGTANTMDNSGNIFQIPLGSYTTVRPDAPAGERGAGADKFVPTPSEQKDLRAQQRALMQQMRLGVTMRDALADAVNEDGTLNVLDGSGKGISFATKMVDSVNALFREGKKVVGLVDENNKVTGTLNGSTASSLAYVNKNPTVFEGFSIPENIRDKGDRAVARYQAAIVQMAYAKARANEPGARQLSDNDFKNALKQIGAVATDPEALRNVLFGDITRGVEDFNVWRSQMQENSTRILGQQAMDQFDDEFEKFNDAFSVDFGAPEAVGPGLRNIDPADRAPGSPAPIPGPGTTQPEVETNEERKNRILGITQ